jgi:hypothetical protein
MSEVVTLHPLSSVIIHLYVPAGIP